MAAAAGASAVAAEGEGEGLVGVVAALTQAPPADWAPGSNGSRRFLLTCCQSLPRAGKISCPTHPSQIPFTFLEVMVMRNTYVAAEANI